MAVKKTDIIYYSVLIGDTQYRCILHSWDGKGHVSVTLPDGSLHTANIDAIYPRVDKR